MCCSVFQPGTKQNVKMFWVQRTTWNTAQLGAFFWNTWFRCVFNVALLYETGSREKRKHKSLICHFQSDCVSVCSHLYVIIKVLSFKVLQPPDMKPRCTFVFKFVVFSYLASLWEDRQAGLFSRCALVGLWQTGPVSLWQSDPPSQTFICPFFCPFI